MPRPVKQYGVVDGNRFYYFVAPEQVYSTLKDDLGWTEGPVAGKIPEKMHPTSSRRVRIEVTLSPAAGSTRNGSGRCLCELSKVEEALAALPGKTYNGRTILSARIPRDITFV